MYQDSGTKREINPKRRANFLSSITFFYTIKLFKKGYKNDLEEEDVFEVLDEYKSTTVGNKLETVKNELEKKEGFSFYALLFKCYGWEYLIFGIVQLIMKTVTIMILPKVLGKLVSYFRPNQTSLTKHDAINYALIIVGMIFVNCIYNHNYTFKLQELGLKVRTAFCSIIYRKCLKLSPAAVSDFTLGKLITLMTKDVYSLDSAILFANDIWIGIIQTILIGYLLYIRIGYATFAGIGFFLALIPLQILIGKKVSNLRLETAKKTDERVQCTQESLSAIKLVKMYTWEGYFSKRISEARKREISKLRQIFCLKVVTLCLGALCSKISFYLLIMTYIWLGETISAEIVYFTLSCFMSLRSTITISIPIGISQLAELHATKKRFTKFFEAEELPEKIPYENTPIVPQIKFNNVTIKINEKEILKDVTLEIGVGLTILTGAVGNGKSSILKSILGDYKVNIGKISTHGIVSYASEEPWVFPATIKQNVLFGQNYDEERYNKVILLCALKYDLDRLANGDNTVIGDRGINISKGQQARINLARAIYRDCDIYLLDDCLSSLDGNVQEHIFDECIKGFLKHKLVIMVSHNAKFIKQADKVIAMENCAVASIIVPSELPENRVSKFIDESEEKRKSLMIEDSLEETFKQDEEQDADEKSGLLEKESRPRNNVYHEETKKGGIACALYKKYLSFGGGMCIGLLIVILFVIAQFAISYSEKLVSRWVDIEPKLAQMKLTNSTEYPETEAKYHSIMKMYTIMLISATFLTLLRSFAHFMFVTIASVNIHNRMIGNVINATMDFFDTHFIGNVLNRFSKDLGTIDEYLPFVIYESLRIVLVIAGILLLIISANKLFIIPAIFLFVMLYYTRRLYIPTGRSLKRLDGSTRSPLVGHLNATLEGLTTIRALEKQKILCKEFDKHQDLFTSTFHMALITSRAFALTLDMLCVLFTAGIIAKCLYFEGDGAGTVGLVITQAFSLTGLLQWGIRQWAELENSMTAFERVTEYTEVETENNTNQKRKDWPKIGEIKYKEVSLTYKKTNETVLRNITFSIKGGEKIGVVGRTGAGKSSIISSLFRLYEIDGQIYIDGVDTKTLSLEFLRSQISIIPQDPVLFTGTIRSNVDPNNKYTDDEIWNALERVELKKSVKNLQQEVRDADTKFSSGERQLICLARALIQKHKIIILDEATANIDLDTAELIHEMILKRFSDCTVITIAHRLKTVLNSDKIMVVDRGTIVEYGVPEDLLNNSASKLSRIARSDLQ